MDNILSVIDHTNIRENATPEDIKKNCDEAKQYGFHGVCVNPKYTELVSQELKGSEIKTVVLIDPPMGLSSHDERMKICEKAKKDGADELDVVMNIVDFKYGRREKVLDDLRNLCKILPTKVIIGSGFLTDNEIIEASKLVKEAGAFCVKMATSLDPLENREIKEKEIHVKLMKESAPGLVIKASGNIRTLSDLKRMIMAGAEIIGTSSGVEMAKEMEK